MAKKQSLWDPAILRQAAGGAFTKLNPRLMIKNPVMLVVEVGSIVTTCLLIRDRMHHSKDFGFDLQITLWLWFTVLFANFAEAMAEGTGQGAGGHAAQGQGGHNGASSECRRLD